MSSNLPVVGFRGEYDRPTNEKDRKHGYDEEHVEAASAGDLKGTILSSNFGQYISDAAEAIVGQKNQSVMGALKQYRRGVLYSIIFSTYVLSAQRVSVLKFTTALS